eukprot:Rmarinus@m.20654
MSLSAPVQCDVDFVLTAFAIFVEENGYDEIANDDVFVLIRISAEADQPGLSITGSTASTEDIRTVLSASLDPWSLDTDGSDRLRKIRVANTLSDQSFASVASCTSVLDSGVFTLSHVGSGFAKGPLLGISVSGTANSDYDFTLSVYALSVEENLFDEHSSTSLSVGVYLSAEADSPLLSVPVSSATTEDICVAVRATADLVSDTDESERLRKMFTVPVPVGLTVGSIVHTKSIVLGSVFTLSMSGSGFAEGDLITGLSASGAVETDVDFTVTLSVVSVETNGLDEVESPSFSVALFLSANADVPSHAAVSTETTEDVSVALLFTPQLLLDTDASERLRKLRLQGTRTGCTFHSMWMTDSSLAGPSYTLSMQNSGYALNALLSSFSVSGAVQSDIDITLIVSFLAVEENMYDEESSTTSTIGIVYIADVDAPSVSLLPTTWATEDVQTTLLVSPQVGIDSDSSEEYRSIRIADIPFGSTFRRIPTVYSTSEGSVYTIVKNGTGFQLNSVIMGLSITGPVDSDVDFTLEVVSVLMETNTLGQVASLPQTSAVVVSADADEAIVTTNQTTTLEDFRVAVEATPVFVVDTDESEVLRTLGIVDFPYGVTLLDLPSTESALLPGIYTLTKLGTGFANLIRVESLSIRPATQTDVDFTLTFAVYTVENNGLDAARGVPSLLGIAVSSMADAPSLAVVGSTATTEDVTTVLLPSPSLVIDTDASEEIHKIFVKSVPLGVTFGGLSSGMSDLFAGQYTLYKNGSGFALDSVAYGFSASAAVQCDADFTFSLQSISTESNSDDSVFGTSMPISVTLSADVDSPQLLASSTSTTEDIRVALRSTPDLITDTDLSEMLRKLRIWGQPLGTSMASLSFTKSVHVGTVYTVTRMSTGFGQDMLIAGLSVSGAVQCDVDFFIGADVSSVEENGFEEVFSQNALLAMCFSASADPPQISVQASASVTEDFPLFLLATPARVTDTEASETVRKVGLTGIPLGVYLPSIAGTSSLLVSHSYTLSSLGSGFSEVSALLAFSVVAAPDSDVDFTFAVYATTVESNNLDESSTKEEIAWAVSAAADQPTVYCPTSLGTSEDISVAVYAYPGLRTDTDRSERLRKIIVTDVPVRTSLTGVRRTKSAIQNGVYTMTKDSTGFANDQHIPTLSLTTALHCDVDFTLGLHSVSVESNGFNQAFSTLQLIELSLSAVADPATYIWVAPLNSTEDSVLPLSFTPDLAVDTDNSERIRWLMGANVPIGMSYSPVADTTSALVSHTYMLEKNGTGFGHGERIYGLSMTPAVESDVDFTIILDVITMEDNGMDVRSGGAQNVSFSLTAEVDDCGHALNATAAIEDMRTAIWPVSWQNSDTDASERLRKLTLSHVPVGVSFISPPATSTLIGQVYTLSAYGSGFPNNAHVAGLSLLPSVECDVDFSFTSAVWTVEDNGYDASASALANVTFALSADADKSSCAITPFVEATEDVAAALLITPSVPLDTDFSERSRSLRLWTVPAGVSFESVNATTSILVSGVFTLTLVGTGFSVDRAVEHFSVSTAAQSDVDFTLSVASFVLEENGADRTVSVGVTTCVCVSAAADLPPLAVNSSTLTMEDVALSLPFTPLLSIDTDNSEVLNKLLIAVLPLGVSFCSLAETNSSLGSSVYTLTTASSGFAPTVGLVSVSLSPSVQSDFDFTVSLRVKSMELSAYGNDEVLSDTAAGPTQSTYVHLTASADEPVLVTLATPGVTEDVRLAFLCTPRLVVDTDSSERLRKLTVQEVTHGSSFVGVGFSVSAHLDGLFTISMLGTGFAESVRVQGFSVSPVVQCDMDFTVLLSSISVENNSLGETASSPSFVTVVVNADADVPLLTGVISTTTTEDTAVFLQVSPDITFDTDASERLRKLLLSVPAGASVAFPSDVSFTPYTYTLVVPGSGFAQNATVGALSVSSVVHSDIDFTISTTVFTVEDNGLDESAAPVISQAVVVSSSADIPVFAMSNSTFTTEDVLVVLAVTPYLGPDTDASERLRTMVVSSVPPASLFTSLESSMLSLYLGSGSYTITMFGSGFGSDAPTSGISVVGSVECDVNFLLTLDVRSSEENGFDRASSGNGTMHVDVRGEADLPVILLQSAIVTEEDVSVTFLSTPDLIVDTDSSEALSLLAVVGVPLGSELSCPTTDVGHVGEAWTLETLGSGFAEGALVSNVSVAGSPNCDIDFTYSIGVMSLESNSGDQEMSLYHSAGVTLAAVADIPSISCPMSSAVVEDVATRLDVTPSIGEDTDTSEALRKLRFEFETASKCSFAAMNSSQSSSVANQYTVTHLGSGFSWDMWIPSLSLAAPTQCDMDFTLTVSSAAVEANNFDSYWSALVSSAMWMSANADVPTLTCIPSGATTEDTSVAVVSTPNFGLDTDGSEMLRKLEFGGLPSGATLAHSDVQVNSSLPGSPSLSMSGTGFAVGTVVSNLSVSASPNCDIDFTIQLQYLAVEQNGLDATWSPSVSVGLLLAASADVANLTYSIGNSTEDVCMSLAVTPIWDTDTDASEHFARLVIVQENIQGISFVAPNRTISSFKGATYTLTMSGSGFAVGAHVRGLSVSGATQTDVDFDLIVAFVSIEANSLNEAVSASESMHILTFADADGAGIRSINSTIASEDNSVSLRYTPFPNQDTDASEIYQKLVLAEGIGLRTTYSAIPLTTSSYADNLYTMTMPSTGFASEVVVTDLCVLGTVDCDVDFKLNAFFVAVELNGLDQARGHTALTKTVLGADADVPDLAVPSFLVWTEDVAAPILLTPQHVADTDHSESLSKLIAENVINGLSFAGTAIGNLTYQESRFTLSHFSTGFTSNVVIPGLSASPPVQSDIDFCFSVLVVSVETNGLDFERSEAKKLAFQLFAFADTAALTVSAFTTTTEDVRVSMSATPVLSDTDASEELVSLSVHPLTPGMSFSPLMYSTSAIHMATFTLTKLGTGFSSGFVVHSLSLSPAAHSDLDFTLSVALSTVEWNGADCEASESVTSSFSVAANADAPLLVSHWSQVNEDFLVAVRATPNLVQDTDASETLRELTISETPAGTSFAGSLTTLSSYSATIFTVFSPPAGFAANVSFAGLSVVGASESDIDFTLAATVVSVESNGGSRERSDTARLATVISAAADQATLILSSVTSMLEDIASPLVCTPMFTLDTDASERLSTLVVDGVLHLSFGAFNGTESSLAEDRYTLSNMHSGFAPSSEITSLSLSSPNECDVDFSLTIRVLSVEQNGRDLASSMSISTAVMLAAVADSPKSGAPKTFTSEDVLVELSFTPYLDDDTDFSEMLRTLTIGGELPTGASFVGVPGSTSTLASARYTLRTNGSGFANANVVSGLSLSPAIQSDVDFTMEVSFYSTEVNGAGECAGSVASAPVLVDAQADKPMVSAMPVSLGTEDKTVLVLYTPLLSADTDASEALTMMMGTSLPKGVTFVPLAQTVSVLVEEHYTLQLHGSGFAALRPVEAPLSPPAESDVDFTMSLSIISVESNEGHAAPSEEASAAVLVAASTDEPEIVARPLVPTMEDTLVSLHVTPMTIRDTDSSESLRTVVIGEIPRGSLLVSAANESAPSDSGLYTVDAFAEGSGFASGAELSSLSISAASQSDIDFTIAVLVVSTETNQIVSDGVTSTTISTGVVVVASADVPMISSTLPTAVVEDLGTAIQFTPRLEVDTDLSEKVVSLSSINLGPVSFSSCTGTVSTLLAAVYTLSLGGSGFNQGTAVLGFSVTGPVESDVDFTLIMHATSLEHNGRDAGQSGAVSFGVGVSAIADAPVPKTHPAPLATEDRAMPLFVCPAYGSDTDSSEMLRKFMASTLSMLSSFSSVPGLESAFISGQYTVTTVASFSTAEPISGLSLSSPVECDADFSFTVQFQSLEANGWSWQNSIPMTVGIELASSSDPPLLRGNSTLQLYHNVSVAVPLTPALGSDTDASETLTSLVAFGFGVEYDSYSLSDLQFSGLVGTSSSVSDTTYTVVCNSRTGFMHDARIASLSLSAPLNCDLDFSLSFGVYAVESNGWSYALSDVVSIAVDAIPDIDECAVETDNCAARGGVCYNTLRSFTCVCGEGYIGNGTACTDVRTEAPTILQPMSGSHIAPRFNMSFALPEEALAGSISLSFECTAHCECDGCESRLVWLSTALEGLYELELPPLTNASTLAEVTSVTPYGDLHHNTWYSMTLSYRDKFNNSVASSSPVSLLLVNPEVPPPTVLAPTNGSVVPAEFYLLLDIPERVEPYSLRLSFVPLSTVGGPHRIVYLSTDQLEAPGTLNLTLRAFSQAASFPEVISVDPADDLVHGESYTISADYVNIVGVAAVSGPCLVAYDNRTLAPTLLSPSSGDLVFVNTSVSLLVPEEPLESSAVFRFRSVSGDNQVDLREAFMPITGPGEYTFSLGSLFETDTGANALVNGAVYVMSFSYQDVVGNDVASDTVEVLFDHNECAEHEDDCGGVSTCANTHGSFMCTCEPFYYYADFACLDFDECVAGMHNCHADGSCANAPGSFSCVCMEGFIGNGTLCGPRPENECELGVHDCIPSASCTDTWESFTCSCKPGYTGDGTNCGNVDECALGTASCHRYAACADTDGSFACSCALGWSGDGVNCTDTQECSLGLHSCNPTQAYCYETTGSFSCACAAGFWDPFGDGSQCRDVEECLSAIHDCEVTASCLNTAGSFSCECDEGFEPVGTGCLDKNECELGIHMCSSLAACTNTAGSFHCGCGAGRSLLDDVYCVDVDECIAFTHNCAIESYCTNSDGSFACDCVTGYVGDGVDCSNTNECDLGVDDCDSHMICYDSIGSFSCFAPAGYAVRNGSLINVNECDASPCPHDFECVDLEGAYECLCAGVSCNTTSPCDTSTCGPFQSCVSVDGGFTCVCSTGYVADGTECVDANECALGTHQCVENSGCANTDGSFECACLAGWYSDGAGESCLDEDECVAGSHSCSPHATCQNMDGSFACSCALGYAGDGVTCTDADECLYLADDCATTATCINLVGSFGCECFSGYVGNGLECVDVDECIESSHNCEEGTACYNTAGGFECHNTCAVGYVLNDGCQDLDECSMGISDCSADGLCENTDGSFACSCRTGFAGNGVNCESVNECDLGHNCGSNTTCVETRGSFFCDCIAGYMLTNDSVSCKNVDECVEGLANCDVNARCSDVAGSFSCTCLDGYQGSGTVCGNLDECALNPCDSHARCEDTFGSFACICGPGYYGDGLICDDLDECFYGFSDCAVNRSICTNAYGSFSCQCLGEYEGDGVSCDSPNLCLLGLHNCLEDAMCTDVLDSFSCSCLSGWGGDGVTTCEDVDECSLQLDNCPKNSTCVNTLGSFDCACHTGYEGLTCANVDECAMGTHTCPYECRDTDGSFSCVCPSGYEGDGLHCSSLDECLLGTHTCTYPFACHNTEGSFSCDCASGFETDECVDSNECATGTHNCDAAATCGNIWGSFTCTCYTGYQGSGVADSCVDDNECELGTHTCVEAVCWNTPGSFSCDCGPGYWSESSDCVACLPGTFKDWTGPEPCVACPDGSTSGSATTDAASCYCLPGYGVSAGNCVLCPKNQYKEGMGSSECQWCPRYASSMEGSVSYDNCTCVEYDLGTEERPIGPASGAGSSFVYWSGRTLETASAGEEDSIVIYVGDKCGNAIAGAASLIRASATVANLTTSSSPRCHSWIPTDLPVLEAGGGQYLIFYNFTCAALHEVAITVDSEPIVHSPFEVEVVASTLNLPLSGVDENSPSFSSVRLADESDVADPMFVRDVYENYLLPEQCSSYFFHANISLKGRHYGDGAVLPPPSEESIYLTVISSLTVVGTYNVLITLDGEVVGAPYAVEVVPGTPVIAEFAVMNETLIFNSEVSHVAGNGLNVSVSIHDMYRNWVRGATADEYVISKNVTVEVLLTSPDGNQQKLLCAYIEGEGIFSTLASPVLATSYRGDVFVSSAYDGTVAARGSPFTGDGEMHVVPTEIAPPEMIVAGEGIFGGFVGYDTYFELVTYDQYENRVNVSAKDLDRVHLAIFIDDENESEPSSPVMRRRFDIPFNMSIAKSADDGLNLIRVDYVLRDAVNDTLCSINVDFDTTPVGNFTALFYGEGTILEADAGNSTVTFSSPVVAGTTTTCTVVARNGNGIALRTGGDDFRAQMRAADSVALYAVDDLEDGRYQFGVYTTIAGTHDLQVLLGAELVHGRSYDFVVVPSATSATKSSLSVIDHEAPVFIVAGALVQMLVTAKDLFGNAQVYSTYDGPDPFLAEAEEQEVGLFWDTTTTNAVIQLTNLLDATYRIDFVPTVAGSYVVAVSLNARLIAGSPVTVEVVPGALDVSCLYTWCAPAGPGLTGSQSSPYFYILAYDEFGNDVVDAGDVFFGEVLPDGRSEAISLDCELSSDNVYMCSYNNEAVGGAYVITFVVYRNLVACTHVTKEDGVTPWPNCGNVIGSEEAYRVSANVEPASASALTTYAYGKGLNTGLAGVASGFHIQAVDIYGRNHTSEDATFVVRLVPNTKQVAIRSPAPVYVDAGLYSISYELTWAGQYRVEILLDGLAEISNSGQTLIVQASDPVGSQSSVSLDRTSTVAGDPVVLTVTLRDEFGNLGEETGFVSAQVTGLDESSYGETWYGVYDVPSAWFDYSTTGGGIEGTAVYSADEQAVVDFVLYTTKAGTYQVDVLISDSSPEPAIGSPVMYSVDPAQAEAEYCEWLLAPDLVVAGQATAGTMNCSDVYGNNINELVSLMVVGTLATTAAETTVVGDPQRTAVTLITAGSYYFVASVVSADGSVQMISPTRHASVTPTSASWETSTILQAANSTTAGTHEEVVVIIKDQYENVLDSPYSVVLNGSLTTEVEYNRFLTLDLATPWIGDSLGTLTSSYTATVAGRYALRVLLSGAELSHGAWEVDVLPGQTDPVASWVDGGGIVGGFKGYDVSVTVHLVDAYGNSQVSVNDLVEVVVWRQEDASDLVSVTLNPEFSSSGVFGGIYHASYATNGDWLLETVYVVEVLVVDVHKYFYPVFEPTAESAAVSPSYSELILESSSFAAGSEIHFWVQPRTSSNIDIPAGLGCTPEDRDFRAVVYDPSGEKHNPVFTCRNAGEYYDAIYVPTTVGDLSIDALLTVNGEALRILSSPRIVSVLPGPTHAATSEVVDLEDSVVAGMVTCFGIIARDEYGNDQVYDYFTGADNFVVTLTPGDQISATDLHDGTYETCVLKTNAQEYIVTVTLDNDSVHGSGSALVVTPAPADASTTIVSAPVDTTVSAGTALYFEMEVLDVYGNVRAAATFNDTVNLLVSGPGSALDSQSTTGPVYFSFTEVLTMNGLYTMDVTLNGLMVEAFEITIVPADADPEQSSVRGPWCVTVEGLYESCSPTAAEPVIFAIYGVDRYGNIKTAQDFTAEAIAMHDRSTSVYSDGRWPGQVLNVTSTTATSTGDASEGRLDIELTPMASGVYNLQLLADGHTVATLSLDVDTATAPRIESATFASTIEVRVVFNKPTNAARISGLFFL